MAENTEVLLGYLMPQAVSVYKDNGEPFCTAIFPGRMFDNRDLSKVLAIYEDFKQFAEQTMEEINELIEVKRVDLSGQLDGSTMAFTVPELDGEAYARVDYNGVGCTQGEDYTIEGTTLTLLFDEAPTAGEKLILTIPGLWLVGVPGGAGN
ncbi:hypothetical protein FACS1894186_4990 [Alphaproteobacteria bacterium]|nr:hypothetical protein FACS1894186_4990 [Alphaproteobacteria bacterium]